MHEILKAISGILRDYNSEGIGRLRYGVYEGMEGGDYVLHAVLYFEGVEVDRVSGKVILRSLNISGVNYCRILVFTQSLYHIMSWGDEPVEA